MRTFVARANGTIGARFVPQLIERGHKVTGTHSSPRTAERVGALGDGPIALGQQPARGWRRTGGGS
jgi:nucleoside-diphosphate-sugar epimerase